jgi:geranylgeranyl pyrophosphate synthase
MNAQSPHNPFAAQQVMLVERLEHLLATIPPVLRTDIELVMEGKGKLLACRHRNATSIAHQTLPDGSWSILTLLVAQYISPDIDPFCASSVAVAIECYICALDILDDIEDEDQTPIIQAIGAARALNVSTALFAIAHTSILSLSQRNIPAERAIQLLNLLQSAIFTATAGQHWDLLSEQRPVQDITFEECIEIAEGKAGALMSLACLLGATCAGANDEMCQLFTEAGKLLGIAHQLDNDSHDLYDLLHAFTSAQKSTLDLQSAKSDLVRHKKTLPIVIAAEEGSMFQRDIWLADRENEKNLKALHEGIIATWGICLLYRERARQYLQKIESRRPIAPALGSLLGL